VTLDGPWKSTAGSPPEIGISEVKAEAAPIMITPWTLAISRELCRTGRLMKALDMFHERGPGLLRRRAPREAPPCGPDGLS